jgi:uncharacterized protein (DUF1684 family)
MATQTHSRLDAYRDRRDHHFAHDPGSPLSAEEQANFAGLSYFPERPDLVFDLPLEVDGADVGERLDLTTSDGSHKPFVRAGRIRFEVDGRPVTLAVFKDPARGRYFLPFRDGTAGVESYQGGRYLDPRERPDGTLHVDFNYAYNPYCAYGEGWSCPIPPTENVVAARIEAGERAFPKHGGGRSD